FAAVVARNKTTILALHSRTILTSLAGLGTFPSMWTTVDRQGTGRIPDFPVFLEISPVGEERDGGRGIPAGSAARPIKMFLRMQKGRLSYPLLRDTEGSGPI